MLHRGIDALHAHIFHECGMCIVPYIRSVYHYYIIYCVDPLIMMKCKY